MITDLLMPKHRLKGVIRACCALLAAGTMACTGTAAVSDNHSVDHATDQGSAVSAPAGPSVVTIEHTADGWQLLRNGEPYFIKGAGGNESLDKLVAAGGNSIRTWDAENIGWLLDEAQKQGLSVAVGIWLEHERHGMNYDDPAQRKAQLDRVRTLVNQWKDHPAVLLWGVGNEVENDGDMGKALRAIEDAAALIKQLDPNHPTMSVTAEIGADKAKRVVESCPSIDILGINSYAGIASLPQRLNAQGVTDKPYIVTEFGPRGHWESPHAQWGAPIEPSSSEKFDMYRKNYAEGIAAPKGRCLGSYVFLWGHKQEVTYSWYGMFLPSGETTPTIDAMIYSWTGKLPEQRAPLVDPIRFSAGNQPKVKPGQTLSAFPKAEDPNGDELRYEWEVISESRDRRTGGDREAAPPAYETDFEVSTKPNGQRVSFKAPTEPGPYRLFLVVHDGTGRAGTANMPFFVEEN